ncbi:MAG: ATP-binding protein [Proteobacteria bacterium]|nr:ATP-binding protein [Pseudomonadota bacterium]
MKKTVVTGGPCSGKTEVISYLKSRYRERLLFVPEFASIVAETGLTRNDPNEVARFQKTIYTMQKSYEATITPVAEQLGKNIVCDRGSIDGASYLGIENFNRIMDTTLERELSSYHIVIHLPTIARDYPELFSNTSIRIETVEQAVFFDDELDKVWGNHGNYFKLKNYRESISQKIKDVIAILERFDIV